MNLVVAALSWGSSVRSEGTLGGAHPVILAYPYYVEACQGRVYVLSL